MKDSSYFRGILNYPAALFLLITLTGYCGGSDGGAGSGASGGTTTVVSTVPADGAEGIDRRPVISITFAEKMNAASVSMQLASGACSGAVQLSADDFATCRGGAVSSTDNPIFDITIGGNLTDGNTYKLRVKGAKSESGKTVETYTHQQGFLVGASTGGGDGTLSVVSTTPADGDSDVALDTTISVEFSHAVDLVSVSTAGIDGACSGTVQLSADNFTTCKGLVLAMDDNPTLAWSTSGLEAGTEYKIKVTTSATGSAGEAMAADYVHTTGFAGCRLLSNGTTCPLSLDYAVTTLAGWIGGAGTENYQDGVGINGHFYRPAGVVSDGSYLFVVDSANFRIRKVEISTGTVSYLVGPNDALCDTGTTTGCNEVGSGNIPSDSSTVTAENARFNFVWGSNIGGITIDSSHTYLYVADTNNNKIRRIRIADGQVNTIAGSGVNNHSDNADGLLAELGQPTGVTYAEIGGQGYLFVTEWANHVIRRITLSGINPVDTVAGAPFTTGFIDDIEGQNARFDFGSAIQFSGIVYDGSKYLYIADFENNAIRRVDATSNFATTTIVGGLADSAGDDTDGAFGLAEITNPYHLLLAGQKLFFTTSENFRLRVADLKNSTVSTIIGPNSYVGPYSSIYPSLSVFWRQQPPVNFCSDYNSCKLSGDIDDPLLSCYLNQGFCSATWLEGSVGNNAQTNTPLGLATNGIQMFITERNGPLRQVD